MIDRGPVIQRPRYNYSVWVKTGKYEDRKVSTFTKKEAEAWKKHLETVFIDKDQIILVKHFDY